MNGKYTLSLIHISEPTRQAEISYAVFCLKKKKNTQDHETRHEQVDYKTNGIVMHNEVN